MKNKANLLILFVFSFYLAACQAETQPTPTLRPFELPEVIDDTSEAQASGEEAPEPSAATPEVADEIIDETQFTAGATATLPPPPPPTSTPTPTPLPIDDDSGGSESGGAGGSGEPISGSAGGENETQSFTNVTINSGTYDGAILETQIASGGGGDIGPSCVGDGEIIPSGLETTDELIAAGCILVDGSPFVICCLISDAAAAQRPWPFSSGANLWNDNLLRIVIHDLDPFEIAKILFYEKNRDLGTMTLLGWQDVQVNSNGFLLLKTELPFPFDNFNYLDSNYDLVLQRANGVMLNDFGFYLDSDGDQLDDGDEAYTYNTDLKRMDSDEDGLGDGEEVITYLTDPLNPDTDGDGRLDGEEVFTYDTDPNVPDSEEAAEDSDGDGLSDEEEEGTYFTDPSNPDSDGDGRSDGDEVAFGTDPTTTMNADGISIVGLTNGVVFQRDFNTELGWVETTGNGDFFYQEDRRGPWGIFLVDASRDLNVHLDFWTKEMSCNGSVCGTVEWVSK